MNRLPEKVYVALLRLIGVKLAPPAAARVRLSFSLAKPQGTAVTIAAGTRVTLARSGAGEPPVFSTAESASIAPGELAIEGVPAFHCTQVDAELAGIGTGLPRQSVRAGRHPIVAPTGDELDLVVGSRMLAGRARPPCASALVRGQELPHLAGRGQLHRGRPGQLRVPGRPHERSHQLRAGACGRSMPTACWRRRLPRWRACPAAGRQIRLWYRCGGGEEGNVAAACAGGAEGPDPRTPGHQPRARHRRCSRGDRGERLPARTRRHALASPGSHRARLRSAGAAQLGLGGARQGLHQGRALDACAAGHGRDAAGAHAGQHRAARRRGRQDARPCARWKPRGRASASSRRWSSAVRSARAASCTGFDTRRSRSLRAWSCTGAKTPRPCARACSSGCT